jgi:uncharacterized protein (DUF433 family)
MEANVAKSRRHRLQELVWKDPDRAGGKLCFRGTRVAVQTLADYLDEGHSVDRFLESFPTVSREQAVRFLHAAVAAAEEETPCEEGRLEAQ